MRSRSGAASTAAASRRASVDVAADQRGHAVPAQVLEDHPELEGPEAARLLEPVLRVPGEAAEALALLGPEIHRNQAPRVAEQSPVADERAPALHRHGEPLVRVERERVRALEPGVARRERRVRRADRAVGAVDVEPQALGLAEVGHRVERVDRARVDRPRARRHAEGPAPGRAVRADGVAERLHVQAEVLVHGHGSHRVSTEPQHLGGLPDAAVALLREIEDEGRGRAGDPTGPDVPAVGGRRPVPGGGEARERGHGAAADQEAHAALDREAHELHQPPDGRALDVDRRVIPTGAARVQGGPEELCDDADGSGRRVHPAEEARVPVAHGVGEDLAPDLVEQALGRRAAGRQGALQERRALRRRHRHEDRLIAEPLEVVGDHVDGGVSQAPERLGRDGRRRVRQRDRLGRVGHERLLGPAGGTRPRRACGLLSVSAMAR